MGGVRSYTATMSYEKHGYRTCNVKCKGMISACFAVHGCNVHSVNMNAGTYDITVTYSYKHDHGKHGSKKEKWKAYLMCPVSLLCSYYYAHACFVLACSFLFVCCFHGVCMCYVCCMFAVCMIFGVCILCPVLIILASYFASACFVMCVIMIFGFAMPVCVTCPVFLVLAIFFVSACFIMHMIFGLGGRLRCVLMGIMASLVFCYLCASACFSCHCCRNMCCSMCHSFFYFCYNTIPLSNIGTCVHAYATTSVLLLMVLHDTCYD